MISTHDDMIAENNDEYYFNNSALKETEHYEIICELKDSENNYIQSPPALFIGYNEAFKIFNEWTTKYEYDRIKLEFIKRGGERVYVETYEELTYAQKFNRKQS